MGGLNLVKFLKYSNLRLFLFRRTQQKDPNCRIGKKIFPKKYNNRIRRFVSSKCYFFFLPSQIISPVIGNVAAKRQTKKAIILVVNP